MTSRCGNSRTGRGKLGSCMAALAGEGQLQGTAGCLWTSAVLRTWVQSGAEKLEDDASRRELHLPCLGE